jgi:hypothetical protein
MLTGLVILGAGQLFLTIAVAYIAWLSRRDARRSSLVSLITVLSELRERNSRGLAVILNLMSTEEFKQGDENVRAGVIDSLERVRAVHEALNEALLHTIHECDAEWGFAGRLHAASKSHLQPGAEKHLEQFAVQHS